MTNTEPPLTTEIYQRMGIFSILILAGFQLFLWSRENRDLKVSLQNEKQATQIYKTYLQLYKIGFISTAGIIGIRSIYGLFNPHKTESSKKRI